MTAERAWKAEAENLRELSEQEHEHLVHRIATMKHGLRLLII